MSVLDYYYGRINALDGKIANLGYSYYKNSIPYIRFGDDSHVLLVGGVHAREHITVDLLLGLSDFCQGRKIDVVPMLNPDGIALAKGGLTELNIAEEEREFLLEANGGSKDFSQWKANGKAVDLNVNFDASWGNGRGNLRVPAPAGYIGPHPESEKETVAIANLLRTKKYALVVAYHSKGEEVYWGFGGNFAHKKEAEEYANALGYTLKTTPHSVGGLKDYWVQYSGRLGLTTEVGKDKFPHPYPIGELPNLLAEHRPTIPLLEALGERLWTTYKST